MLMTADQIKVNKVVLEESMKIGICNNNNYLRAAFVDIQMATISKTGKEYLCRTKALVTDAFDSVQRLIGRYQNEQADLCLADVYDYERSQVIGILLDHLDSKRDIYNHQLRRVGQLKQLYDEAYS